MEFYFPLGFPFTVEEIGLGHKSFLGHLKIGHFLKMEYSIKSDKKNEGFIFMIRYYNRTNKYTVHFDFGKILLRK
jgi:hypothetical protein